MKSRPLGIQSILATDHNTRRDDARGGSFLLPHQQQGALALPTNPTNGQTITITINGTAIVITAVTGTPTNPNDVKAPGTPGGFAANVVNFLRRPDVTNANQIAATVPNQALLFYLGWSLPVGATTITPFSLNKSVNGATSNFSSLAVSTTVTGASWSAQTMQLYVEDGTYYINGTRYLFNGGSTPTVSAPISNPRIDVLTIDTTGSLAWTTGTENASPVFPTYPANKLAICELYNVVSETFLYDGENQQAGQGYIYNDVRPTTTSGPILSSIPDDLLPDVTDTRSLGSSSHEWLSIYGKNVFVGGAPVAGAKFGGTGADGSLSATSGATNIDLGGAAIMTKNYTSISITGTGYITFSNPSSGGTIVVLKSQGNVTVSTSATSAFVLVGVGGAGGATPSGTSASGNGGSSFGSWIGAFLGGGGGAGNGNPGAGGGGGGASATSLGSSGSNGSGGTTGGSGGSTPSLSSKVAQYIKMGLLPGSGGGSGGNGFTYANQGGAGGAGGGALYVECAGALNITATISAAGTAGSNQAGGNGGGGGGGAGGCIVILYNTLTANSGTYTVTGASGGAGGSGYGGGGGGANGFSLVTLNTEFA